MGTVLGGKTGRQREEGQDGRKGMKSNIRIFHVYKLLFMLILTQDFNKNDMFKSRAVDPQDAIQAR